MHDAGIHVGGKALHLDGVLRMVSTEVTARSTRAINRESRGGQCEHEYQG